MASCDACRVAVIAAPWISSSIQQSYLEPHPVHSDHQPGPFYFSSLGRILDQHRVGVVDMGIHPLRAVQLAQAAPGFRPGPRPAGDPSAERYGRRCRAGSARRRSRRFRRTARGSPSAEAFEQAVVELAAPRARKRRTRRLPRRAAPARRVARQLASLANLRRARPERERSPPTARCDSPSGYASDTGPPSAGSSTTSTSAKARVTGRMPRVLAREPAAPRRWIEAKPPPSRSEHDARACGPAPRRSRRPRRRARGGVPQAGASAAAELLADVRRRVEQKPPLARRRSPRPRTGFARGPRRESCAQRGKSGTSSSTGETAAGGRAKEDDLHGSARKN